MIAKAIATESGLNFISVKVSAQYRLISEIYFLQVLDLQFAIGF